MPKFEDEDDDDSEKQKIRIRKRRGGFLLEGGDGSLVAGELRRSRACCSAAF